MPLVVENFHCRGQRRVWWEDGAGCVRVGLMALTPEGQWRGYLYDGGRIAAVTEPESFARALTHLEALWQYWTS